jgi:copper chaperone CopZ
MPSCENVYKIEKYIKKVAGINDVNVSCEYILAFN